jgi:hypothetical protein
MAARFEAVERWDTRVSADAIIDRIDAAALRELLYLLNPIARPIVDGVVGAEG